MDSREEAIQQIEGLFPTDSEYKNTNKVGERLLAQAKREMEGWRNESTPVLIKYAELCVAEENRQERESRHFFSNRAGHH